jgi:hypothetical protein
MPEHDVATGEPAGQSNPDVDQSELHVATPADATQARARDDRLAAILRRADVRDRAAEVRDRDAEERGPDGDPLDAAIDRDWAGRDRDRAAEDRADLLALSQPAEPTTDPSGGDDVEP